MAVPAGQRAGRAVSDVPRIADAASTSRSLEAITPSGARRPQLPPSAAQRRRASICGRHGRRAAAMRGRGLQLSSNPAHEPRRRRSAAGRAIECGGEIALRRCSINGKWASPRLFVRKPPTRTHSFYDRVICLLFQVMLFTPVPGHTKGRDGARLPDVYLGHRATCIAWGAHHSLS